MVLGDDLRRAGGHGAGGALCGRVADGGRSVKAVEMRCDVCGELIARDAPHAHGWIATTRSALLQRRRERRERRQEKQRGTENLIGRLAAIIGTKE